MAMTKRSGKVKKKELPDTLQRSPKKAQRIFAKVHDAVAEEYGEGRSAHQTAYSALEHGFVKVGDRWEKKQKKDASGPQRRNRRATAPSKRVDANASKRQLMGLAQRLEVSGRSSMNKDELVNAINKAASVE